MNPETLRERLRGVIQGTAPALSPEIGSGTRAPYERALGGEWRETPRGRSFVVTRRYEADAHYGRQRIGDFHERLSRASASARLFGAPTARPPFVFFDLETTGLNGGAGTFAFLVGCGRFETDGAFITEQHLMVDSASERSMLRAVADDLARAGALVTFNGKSFDAPLVETRYLFHRAESPCGGLPHVDMLHPARRFWGAASEAGCSLTTLEARLLGVRRVGDVPGFEIPGRYFHFVRTGDAQPLAAVFEHNRLDLVSLAGLTAHLFSLAEEGHVSAQNAHEALALGKTFERAGLTWRAEEAFEHAITMSGPSAMQRLVKIEALRALALEARRARRYDDAARRWQTAIDTPGCPVNIWREASQALAVHHEHRLRDLEAAKRFALQSLELDRGVAWGDAVRHRLARIERKLISEKSPLFPSSPLPPASAVRPSVPRTSS